MASGYDINIFRAPALKGEAYFGEFFWGYGFTQALLGDLPVLAEFTAQITAGYENCSGSASADKGGLFALVY
jgi:hypothetical protein